MSYVHPNMAESLKDHILEEIPAGEAMRTFWMKRPGTRIYGVFLAFTPAGIVLAGDICLSTENGRGVVGDPGYGLDWFTAKDLAENYLCSKFYRDTHWEKERAIAWCGQHAEEILKGEWDTRKMEDLPEEKLRELRLLLARQFRVLAQSLGASSIDDEIEFGRELHRLGFNFEDLPGRGYPSAEAGWLCAIQRRFAELYETLVGAAKT